MFVITRMFFFRPFLTTSSRDVWSQWCQYI